MELPLKAHVYTTDGEYGKLLALVVKDDAPVITHVEVVAHGAQQQPRLVPFEHVTGADAGKVQINVASNHMNTMTEATQLTNIYEKMPEPVLDPLMLRAQEHVDQPQIEYAEQDLIPPGTVLVDEKTDVSARGGAVGKLGAVVVQEGTGQIESVIVHESLLHGGKSVTFPASAIDHMNGPTVLLTMHKDEITA